MEKHICDYGCGQEAKFQFKNGNWCCSKNIAQCPVFRKKNSESKKGENNPNFGKKPFKEVKNFIESTGYKLLSSEKDYEYPSKLKVRCLKNHEYEVTWYDFKYGSRCKKCSDEKQRTPFREIKNFVENEGWQLITTKEEYENHPKEKLRVICPNGHEIRVFWNGSKQGIRCKRCADELSRKRQVTPFEDIRKIVENEGYELLSKKEEYKNNTSKLKFRCLKKHEFKTSWDSFKSGSRCKECFNERQRISFKEIKKFVENEDYELLLNEKEYKKEYKDCYSKLRVKCPKGHEYPTSWNSFRSGYRCPECFRERQRNPSQETRKKMRLSKIKDMESKYGQTSPNYNPEGCRMIDEYGKENNYNFQHAENGGEYHIKELGYWVDGYDKKRNTVIEIDEYHHFDRDGNLSKKDLERQKEISDFLGCKFIRLRI